MYQLGLDIIWGVRLGHRVRLVELSPNRNRNLEIYLEGPQANENICSIIKTQF